MTTGYEELQMDFTLCSDFEGKTEDEIHHWKMPSNVHEGKQSQLWMPSDGL